MPDYDIAALLRPKCKVCSAPIREGIDLRLLGKETHEDGERYSYEEIVDWAAAHGLQISKAGLSRHRTDHLMPDVLGAIEAQRQVEAIAQATGQTLGMEQAAMNILLNKWIRALDKVEDFDLGAKGALSAGIRAVEALLKIKKAELTFSKEKLEEAKDTMRGKGVSEDTLQLMDELLGVKR